MNMTHRFRLGLSWIEARQSGKGASFVFRVMPLIGLLGHPNVFVLHQDSQFALIYICQAQFIFFNVEVVYILSRDQFPSQSRLDDVENLLRVNDINLRVSRLKQAACNQH